MLFRPLYTPEIPPPDNAVNRACTERMISALRDSGLQAAKEQYSRKSPEEQLLEFRMRETGFASIDNGEPELALRIFELNLHAHPHSAKALQALGEGYMETGKNVEALKYFHQSLDIEADNRFVRDMILKLEQ